MKQALTLAQKGQYTCAPNPMVGCVIVKDDRLIGCGFHERTGGPHAEVFALREAGENAHNADVYLTLEPCSHTGRTPPCVNALLAARVKRVHIALLDPNPLVNGKGVEALKNAGIEVVLGEEQEAAYQLNQPFFHVMKHRRPYVIAKWAMTLDGKIGTPENSPLTDRWITGEQSRRHSHLTRARVCGIAIGAQTLRHDRPQLTVRLPDFEANQPIPIIVTLTGDIDLSLPLFHPSRKSIVITGPNAPTSFLKALEDKEIKSIIAPFRGEKELELTAALSQLPIKTLLVEGGRRLLSAFYKQNLINEIHTYIAPRLMDHKEGVRPPEGNFCNQITSLHSLSITQLGDDICMTGKLPSTPKTYEDYHV